LVVPDLDGLFSLAAGVAATAFEGNRASQWQRLPPQRRRFNLMGAA